MRTPDVISREKQRLALLINGLRHKKAPRSMKEEEILRKSLILLKNLNFRTYSQRKAGWR
jgi:hypothetical protein